LPIAVFGQAAPAPADAARATPGVLPTDVTPLIYSGERSFLSREMKYSLLKRLPSRLWFNVSAETSQRLETNPQFFVRDAKPDYIFRVMPNVTLGYNVFKNTSIYANYFVIKDVFARFGRLDNPTTQSLAWGLRQTAQLGRRTSAQFDFQARELWQQSHLHQFDFLPSVSLNYTVSPRVVLFASSVLQLRGKDYFLAPTREIDPFYSVGMLVRRGLWTFLATDTLVTNFRDPPFAHSVPQHGNVSMIADFEINHPISSRYLPGVVAFLRAEPVWDWRSGRIPGLSGFDFRLFSGIRLSLSKPSYAPVVDKMRRQIEDYDNMLKTPPKKSSSAGSIGQNGRAEPALTTNQTQAIEVAESVEHQGVK
jgi:hypothetical protein